MSVASLHLGILAAAGLPSAALCLAGTRWRVLRPLVAPLAAFAAALVLGVTGQAPLTLLAAVAVSTAGVVLEWPFDRSRVPTPTSAGSNAAPEGDDGPDGSPKDESGHDVELTHASGRSPTGPSGLNDPGWIAVVLAAVALVLLDPGAGLGVGTAIVLGIATFLAMLAAGGVGWIGSARLVALLLLAATAGVYLGVPDTEGAVALGGALLPVAVLFLVAAPEGDHDVGRSLAPFVAVFAVTVGHGSVSGEPRLVVGGAACLGLLLTLPLVATAMRRRWRPLARRIDGVAVAAQAAAAIAIARFAMVGGTTDRVAVVAAAGLGLATVVTLVVARRATAPTELSPR